MSNSNCSHRHRFVNTADAVSFFVLFVWPAALPVGTSAKQVAAFFVKAAMVEMLIIMVLIKQIKT
jgi:hypothetical protein